MGSQRTKKGATATGKRKTARNNKENIPDISAPTTERPRPRAIGKPLRKRVAAETPPPDDDNTTGPIDNDTALAAETLLTFGANNHENPFDRVIRRALKIPDSESLSEEDGEEGDEDEDEEDELRSSADETDHASLPKSRDFFDVPFEVPFGGATRNLSGINSRTPFPEFLEALAGRMETRLSLLSHIAFIPSYKPKNPKPTPKLLEDDDDWEKLLDDIEEFRNTKARGKAAGQPKVFHITIFDMLVSDTKETKKTKKTSADAAKADAEQPEREHELLRKIEKRHMCNSCNKPCFVLSNGDHYVYTMRDLATWACLLHKHKATIDTPPEELNLADARPRASKKVVIAPTTPAPTDPMQMMQQVLGMFMGGLVGTAALTRSPEKPLQIDPVPPSPTPAPKRSAEDEITPENLNIDVWLTRLDIDPVRGKKKINFYKFAAPFTTHGIYELSDIATISTQQIMELGGDEMNFGIANRLMQYAAEDYGNVKRSRQN